MRSSRKSLALLLAVTALCCSLPRGALAQGAFQSPEGDAAGLLSLELPEVLPEAQNEFVRRHSFRDAEFRRKQSRLRGNTGEPGAQAASQGKVVRMVYLVPSDREARRDYEVAIQNAILHMQAFYLEQMGGQTFSVNTPVVEVYKTPHAESFYSTGQNAGTYGFWESVLADAFALTGGGFHDPDNRWIYYIDAQSGCGQVGGGGTSGVATLPANDLRGLTGQENVPTCTGGFKDTSGVCRWVGGLGHELGHAFNLPHPPGCDANDPVQCGSTPRNSLMYLGYASFPSTYLLSQDKTSLGSSGFFAPFGLATPGSSFCLTMLGQSPNPINDAGYFVRWHYKDFLSREPDDDGYGFWTGGITSCGSDPQCIEVKRIDTSAAFFLAIEFQQTGYLVERMYKVAYGDATGITTWLNGQSVAPTQIPVPAVRRSEFLADSAVLQSGLIVGQAGWEQVLDNNKQAFASQFVQRGRFTTEYPTAMTPAQFVAKLNGNVGGALSQADVDALVAQFGGAADTSDASKRAVVIRLAAENAEVERRERSRAFVLMQFFGYLHRDPDASPDTNHTGWRFWLEKLEQFNGNYVQAEMVKAFLNSTEYRQRFGQP